MTGLYTHWLDRWERRLATRDTNRVGRPFEWGTDWLRRIGFPALPAEVSGDAAACVSRYVAKNIVAAGLASKCSVQLAYAIGIAKPFSVYVNTFGTGKISDEKLEKIIVELFDLTPQGMIEKFGLLKGDIYHKIPRTLFMDDYLWEKTDMVKRLLKAVKA